jgi:hypothetical protein
MAQRGPFNCSPSVLHRGLRAVIFYFSDGSTERGKYPELCKLYNIILDAQKDINSSMLNFDSKVTYRERVIIGVKLGLFLAWTFLFAVLIFLPFMGYLSEQIGRSKKMLALIPNEMIQNNPEFLQQQRDLFKIIE